MSSWPCSSGGVAGVGDDVVLVVDHALELAGAHVEHQADAATACTCRTRCGETGTASSMWPMRSRRTRLRVTSTPQRSQIDALVLDALVLAAGALPVPGGTEDPLAEQAALFGLEGPVVDGFRVLHLALGPGADDFRGGHGDGDLVKGFRPLVDAEEFAKIGVDAHDDR